MAVSASAARRPLRRAGGREQGRGVRAGSLGLRAPRLPALGHPRPGRLREDRASGRMARRRRPGRGRRRRRPRGPGGGAWRGDWSRWASGASASCRPPGCAARLNEAMWPSFAEVPRCSRAGELGRGQRRGPPPGRTPTRRDPTPRRRSRDQRKRAASGPMVQGLGVWPIAGSRQDRALGAGPRAQPLAPRFPTPRRAQRSPPERPPGGPGGAQGLVLRRLAWGSGGPSNHVR